MMKAGTFFRPRYCKNPLQVIRVSDLKNEYDQDS